jgi:hypothetical protein
MDQLRDEGGSDVFTSTRHTSVNHAHHTSRADMNTWHYHFLYILEHGLEEWEIVDWTSKCLDSDQSLKTYQIFQP